MFRSQQKNYSKKKKRSVNVNSDKDELDDFMGESNFERMWDKLDNSVKIRVDEKDE